MAENEVQGIALGLGLDTTGWSAGIAKARSELDALRRDARNLVVNAQIKGGVVGGGRGGRSGLIASQDISGPNVSPGFNVTRAALRQLRVDMNLQLRQLAQQGQAVMVPVKLARIPYAAMRTEISRGIGEVPITVRVSSIAGQRNIIAGLLASSPTPGGSTMPRRSEGGRVNPYQPVVVGEKRPEVFVADRPGTIIPRAMGGAQILARLQDANRQLRPHHIAGGVDWYKMAGRLAAQKAQQYGMELRQAQGILAALSAGTSWQSNKTKFEKVLSANAAGKPFPYDMNLDAHRKALSILQGSDPAKVFATSPKISQFFKGIAGDPSALTIDRWAARTAIGKDRPPSRGPARRELEAAWHAAAAEVGLQPAEHQAALWLMEKERSGQAPGQMGLGLARGGSVSPGQKSMFFAEAQPGYCSRCRVSYTAGAKSRHYLSDSHADIVSGRRRPSFAASRSRVPWNKGMGRSGSGTSLARALEGPDEEELLRHRMDDDPRYAMRVMAGRPYDPRYDEDPGEGTHFIEGFARGGRVKTPHELAYEAGWNASRRSTTFDLGDAEHRFEKKHGRSYGGTMFAAGWGDYSSGYEKGTSLRRMARGGFTGGIAALRDAAAEYAQSRGMAAPPTGFYHPIDEDFSRRTAAAYEAMPTGPDALSRRAYRAFADETLDQYRFLRGRGFHFTPSRTDPYRPTATHSKMELAGLDVLRNRNMNAFASALEHPLLSNTENWIFRGVHDLFGHLAEGFSIGPRGEMNAAIKHSQMYSPLAQRAMLAETHGQNSVVNFSPTIAPGFGRSIADVNRESPGTIYAQQKAQVLPKALVDEFNARFGIRRARGGPSKGRNVRQRLLEYTTEEMSGKHLAGEMAKLGYDWLSGSYRRDSTGLGLRHPTKDTIPWAWMPWEKNAEGGDVPPGTYIVNEIGRERFVPKELEHKIPPEVAAQIPGGGLLARRLAQEATTAEPWKPAWLRRNNAKDLTRASGGMIDIPGSGPTLWQAPGDGWIIPNRLMNKVPRAATGAPTNPLDEPMVPEGPYAGYSRVGTGARTRYQGPGGRFVSRSVVSAAQRLQAAQAREIGYLEDEHRALAERIKPLRGRAYASAGVSSTDELRALRAESIPVGGRTPRTLLGGAVGFLARGERAQLAEEQYRTSTRGLIDLTRALPKGTNVFQYLNNQVSRARLNYLELAKAHGADNAQVKQSKALMQESVALRTRARDLERERAEALGQIKTGVPDVAKSFLALQGTFAAYQIGLSALNATVELGAKVLAPMVDQMTGWSGVALKVGQELGQSAREMGGNAPAAIAAAAGRAGIGGESLAYLQSALGPMVSGTAGGSAAIDAMDLRRAAFYARTRGGVPGLTGGPTGGLAGSGFGWQVLGGQESFSQTIARQIGEFQQAATQPRNGVNVGGVDIPITWGGLFPKDWDQTHPIGGNLDPQGVWQAAGREALSSVLRDTNQGAARGAQYLGQQDTGLQLMRREDIGSLANDADWQKAVDQFKAAAQGAADLDNATKEAAANVILYDKRTGQAVTSSEQYRKFLQQSAQGSQIETPEAFGQRVAMDLRGAFKSSAAAGQFERGTMIPAQFALDMLANPLSKPSAGFGLTDEEQGRYGGSIATIQRLQDGVAAGVADGLSQARSLVANYGNPQAVDPYGPGGSMSNIYGPPVPQTIGGGPDVLAQFDSAVADIAKYGGAIRDLNDEISNAQAGLARRQYSNSIRILSRSLQDALALAGKAHTGGAAGEIERQQFQLGRQSQSLQMQLTQRQLNFQVAVAGFQAPGITGQERAARIEEAKVEASFGQQQLDIQKRQFALEGRSFTVQAERAVTDLRHALDLETMSRDTTLLTIRNQKMIAANQVQLSRAQAQASSILQQAARNHDAILSVADARVRLFGGTIEGATNALRSALGLGAPVHTYMNAQGQVVTTGGGYTGQISGAPGGGGGPAGHHAAGAFGLTSPGGHVAMYGEANTEGVIAIKNPTVRELGAFSGRGMAGGGSYGPVHIGPFVFEGSKPEAADLDGLARAVSDLVESRMGVKAKLVGLASG